ncbi:hypothetical protein L873DRAFT_1823015 [Choiromyces venosus 120613-1]|uniref:Uncharacterized protein n=1 Tax=Choiromyces venosus 120613-1 TaxID=1336337 RepID=A0A3N4IX15_9PEZI|nr:hypothetical protein L873DRAFT_1823015 [Choiromyces venosus 120613-1]
MHNSAPSLFYLIGLFMIRYQTPHHNPIYAELLVTTYEDFFPNQPQLIISARETK